MKISSGWMAAIVRGSLVLALAGSLGACAGSSASSGSGTTPAGGGGGGGQKNGDKAPAGSVEEEALVRIKPNMFPPVDVGAWVCEPKSWTDKGVHLHCTAPSGTTGLLAALRAEPAVESAEPAK